MTSIGLKQDTLRADNAKTAHWVSQGVRANKSPAEPYTLVLSRTAWRQHMPSTRTERDSLGDVLVPEAALYAAQTQRAVDNFPISGERMPRGFIAALGAIKTAAAIANGELGLLDAGKVDAIVHAAEQVASGCLHDQFPIDVYQTGSGTSTNMNANEVIATVASRALDNGRVHPNDDVNMCQSSNDVIPTAMHISAAVAITTDLIPALTTLRDGLRAKSDEFDDVVKSGRTHLMDATPVRLGQEFGGYAQQIESGIKRLRVALDELAELALGGTATGSGINRHPDFPRRTIALLSKQTGIEFREATNHFEAQSAKDGVVMAHGALNVLAVSLLKIANDIRYLSAGPTSGIGEIRLPAVQPGSSIMPGKVNPVLAEAMMMACARVMGNHTTITVCGQHGNLQLNVMMPVMAQAMLQSISILAGACRVFHDRCLTGIEADRAQCRELLELNPSIATALNATVGYDTASEVAKTSARTRMSVRETVRAMGLLTDEELNTCLDVRRMTEPGIPGA